MDGSIPRPHCGVPFLNQRHALSLLDAADKAVSLGDLDRAQHLAAQAGGQLPEALAVQARIHLHRGRRDAGLHLLRRVAAEAPHLAAVIEASGDRRLMLAWLEARAVDARSRQVFRECPILGPFAPELSAHAEATIVSLLEAGARGAELPAPPPSALAFGSRVGLILPRFLRGDPAGLECDFFIHLPASARAAGATAEVFVADGILYDRPGRDPGSELDRLEAWLATFRPDLVVFEANFLPTDTSLTPRHLARLQRQFGFRLVALIGDLHDCRPDFLGAWGDVADRVLAFHGLAAHLDRFRRPEKLIWLPSMPFDETLFEAKDVDKDIGLSLVGTNRRARLDYARALAFAGVEGVYRLHDRRPPEAPDTLDYAAILRRSKLVFNNGEEADGTAMITGRFTEAVLAGAVVIQEAGAPIERFYTPYRHFIPVANAHQAVAFAQFLLKYESWRLRIAKAALDHCRNHHSSRHAWAKILGAA